MSEEDEIADRIFKLTQATLRGHLEYINAHRDMATSEVVTSNSVVLACMVELLTTDGEMSDDEALDCFVEAAKQALKGKRSLMYIMGSLIEEITKR